MYVDDHPPPHFHAKYGAYEAQVVIATGELLNGDLLRRARALVKEWTELPRDEPWTTGLEPNAKNHCVESIHCPERTV